MVSRLQGQQTATVDDLFERSGFWQALREAPMPRELFLEAVRLAPTIKDDYFTVLSPAGLPARSARHAGERPAPGGLFQRLSVLARTPPGAKDCPRPASPFGGIPPAPPGLLAATLRKCLPLFAALTWGSPLLLRLPRGSLQAPEASTSFLF